MGYFGLLGYPLGHSFSKPWFEARAHRYDNFAYQTVDQFIQAIPTDLQGFNVTIPHKEAIIPFLDEIDPAAQEVGAVNCVKILEGNRLKGYNTDILGFEQSLRSMIGPNFTDRAAVLGSGGASKAVCYVLGKLNIDHQVVTRKDDGYSKFKIEHSKLIINTTPLGMFPKVDAAPTIDYSSIDETYYLYDLVYNPSQTKFLTEGRKRGATVKNGLEMLTVQAQEALLLFLAL